MFSCFRVTLFLITSKTNRILYYLLLKCCFIRLYYFYNVSLSKNRCFIKFRMKDVKSDGPPWGSSQPLLDELYTSDRDRRRDDWRRVRTATFSRICAQTPVLQTTPVHTPRLPSSTGWILLYTFHNLELNFGLPALRSSITFKHTSSRNISL